MSKFTTAAATSHTLSLTAMEEASRLGQRTADIDHLFLALVVNEQAAGQVLRRLGITLDAARDAVHAQHAEQLASLGVGVELPAPGRIVFHETAGYEWGERPMDIIRRSSDGDAAAILRELVGEPSGLIEAILDRLGTSPAAVIAHLDEIDQHPLPRRTTVDPELLSGSSEAFAPAPVAEVWALLTDPARMPQWEPTIESVAELPASVQVGSTWTAQPPTARPDGKPLRVRPGLESALVEVTALDEPHRIELRVTWPDAPKANARRYTIELEPAAGGTHLRIALAWERNPARRRIPLLGVALRPLHRFLVWLQLSQVGAGIGRVFR